MSMLPVVVQFVYPDSKLPFINDFAETDTSTSSEDSSEFPSVTLS